VSAMAAAPSTDSSAAASADTRKIRLTIRINKVRPLRLRRYASS
jgi:hypothetical protein